MSVPSERSRYTTPSIGFEWLPATRLEVSGVLWALAILTYGIGDVATTMYFVAAGVGTEGHPVVAAAIDALGLWILVPWKLAAIGLFYIAYRTVPREYAVGIPIGLAIVGTVLTTWNLYGAYLGRNPVPIF